MPSFFASVFLLAAPPMVVDALRTRFITPDAAAATIDRLRPPPPPPDFRSSDALSPMLGINVADMRRMARPAAAPAAPAALRADACEIRKLIDLAKSLSTDRAILSRWM